MHTIMPLGLLLLGCMSYKASFVHRTLLCGWLSILASLLPSLGWQLVPARAWCKCLLAGLRAWRQMVCSCMYEPPGGERE